MKNDYTHISIILDRTGSMQCIRDDTIGGFNSFLRDQKSQPGTATITLVQFDSQDPYEVIHHFKPIQTVQELGRRTYVPRASTPLLDALGRGINDLEKSIEEIVDDERPLRIVFVVITDGQENASREFRRDQVVKMIREKTDTDKWQFVFLSADLDAIDDAMSYGFTPDAALAFQKTTVGTAVAFASLSSKISDYRTMKKAKIGFDPEDRKHPEDPAKKSEPWKE